MITQRTRRHTMSPHTHTPLSREPGEGVEEKTEMFQEYPSPHEQIR